MKKEDLKSKILLITYGVVLFVLLMNYQWLFDVIGFVGKIILPFIIGIITAFVINVLMKMLEEKLFYKLKKAKRACSLISSLFIIFGFIVVLMFILIPQLKNAGMIFVENLPEYHENIMELGKTIGLNEKQLEVLSLDDTKILDEISSILGQHSKSLLGLSFGLVNSVVSAVCNFFVGLVFAIYVLVDKENLSRQVKKVLKVVLSKKHYNKFIEFARLSNNTFSSFVKVQVLEACILGFLCFLGMLLFRLPYAATISVLVGFTALIPIFGAFIGCLLGAFLIFMISPISAVIFVVFFLILQQIEGNFIYPKVVGGKIGLPSIWVLVAVMIGGSVGGIFGMLLGVPVVSILYSLLKTFINSKEKKETVN